MTIVIVGASGMTGGLVAREAAAAGLEPVLLGRHEEPLARLARELECDYSVMSLDDPRLADTFAGAQAVINVAGPFETTVGPVLDAAIRARIPYLDLCNDLPAVSAVVARHEELREAGVVAMPSVGFGTVATDGLARLLADAVPDAVSLELAMLIDGDGRSAGAAASTAEVVRGGGAGLTDGTLRSFGIGRHTFSISEGGGGRYAMVPIALGDLAISPVTTGIRTVSAAVALPVPRLLAPVLLPLVAGISARAGAKAPAAKTREYTSRAWARVRRPDGSTETAWLAAGEGYLFSARSAVAAASAVLQGKAEPGAVTAAGQFGAGFLAGIEGAHLGSTLDGPPTSSRA